jgi:hypothetical protein
MMHPKRCAIRCVLCWHSVLVDMDNSNHTEHSPDVASDYQGGRVGFWSDLCCIISSASHTAKIMKMDNRSCSHSSSFPPNIPKPTDHSELPHGHLTSHHFRFTTFHSVTVCVDLKKCINRCRKSDWLKISLCSLLDISNLEWVQVIFVRPCGEWSTQINGGRVFEGLPCGCGEWSCMKDCDLYSTLWHWTWLLQISFKFLVWIFWQAVFISKESQ